MGSGEGSPIVTLYLYNGLSRYKVLLLVMLCVDICSPYIHLDEWAFWHQFLQRTEGMDFCTKKPYYSFARLSPI